MKINNEFLDNTEKQSCKSGVIDSFSWSTEEYHHDNAITMNDYLDNHLLNGAKIMFQDGSYAEIIIDGQRYALDAKGDGDSFNHIVTLNAI
jgi:hypothetical protein